MLERKDYRPVPFWSWNDKLEQKKLKEQIHWMHDNGIGGFFMHARSGLQTEYLSEEWMQCIEACQQEAEKLDMKAWVYDENGWPSGFAGGKLLEDEKNHDKYIQVKEGAYDETATVSYLVTQEELVRVSHALTEEKPAPINERTDGENVCTSHETGGEAAHYLNLYIRTSVSTADILNPEVVDKFLALTHEKYKERFGEEFSEKIEGLFTDEPQYYRWATPYTDAIAAYWREQYGEDILNELGLLFAKKKGWRSFRYRYWKGMQSLMLRNFAEKVYRWCDENGVKLTGHYVEESGLAWQMMCCGGIMPFYEYEHIPGIDWLGKRTTSELAAKQVGSVAAQLGRNRVLTETFGCCGWDVLPSELRRIAGFQYVNGVNMMCHHLVPYSERGSRKYDYPAHYSTVNPWVKEEYKTFNDYYTELGYLLGEGKKRVNVAMLHPIRSAYFEYQREMEKEGCGIRDLDNRLQEACRTLSSRGIDYHFLDETLLAKYGFVKDKQIGCGRCAYDYLVLPSLMTMDAATEKLIREFVQQGGRVLLLDGKPGFMEAEEYDYDYLTSNVTLEEICDAQPYRVRDFDTEIYSTYRRLEGKEYLYIMNSSAKKTYAQTFDCGKASFTVTLKPGEDALFMLSQGEEPGVKQLMLSSQSRRDTSEENKLTPYSLRFQNAAVSVAENILPVDVISYSTDGEHFSKPWPCAALFQKLLKERYRGELFLRYEFDVEALPEKIYLRAEKSNDLAAWINGTELPVNTHDTACVSVCDGTDADAHDKDYVNVYDITGSVHTGRNHYTVKVDWFQKEEVYYALFGENVTESLKNCIVYDTELQPIELTGSFGVYPKNGYVEDKDPRFLRGEDFYIGSLPECIVLEPVAEGFPFLAGEMTLRQKCTFDTADILLKVAGEYQMASVKVNGLPAGKLFFDQELDISPVAKAGENEIEVRFLLGNRNRMGPYHLTTDKDEGVSPFSFELSGHWNEDQCPLYHADYDIKRVYQ